jgi:hypothetical protein
VHICRLFQEHGQRSIGGRSSRGQPVGLEINGIKIKLIKINKNWGPKNKIK